MKRFSLLLICLLTLVTVKSQDDKKNTVKFNFFGLGVRTLSFQYERTITDHIGLCLQFGYTFSRSVPNSIFKIDTLAKNSSYNQLLSAKFTGGYQVTPEFRYYFKGEGNKGFYLGLYGRQSNYGLAASLIHRDNNSKPLQYYNFTGKWKATNVGIIMGNQWHLGESITLDWWIVGLQFGQNKINMTCDGDFSTTDKAEYISDAKANFADTKIVSGLDATMTDTEATLKFAVISPGIRTGLCLGFRF